MDFYDKILSDFEVDERLENDRDLDYNSEVQYEAVKRYLWKEFEGSEISETVVQAYISAYIEDVHAEAFYGSSPKQLEIVGKFTDKLREEEFIETRKNTLYVFEERPNSF